MQDEYKRYVRKFATCDILEHYSKESIDIYNDTDFGVKFEEVDLYNTKTGCKIATHQFHIAQWDLLEICFNAIKFGNDYRNCEIDRNAHYDLINKTKSQAEILEKASELTSDNLFKHLLCIANMEFDLEKINIKNKFNRINYIMTNINKNPKYNQSEEVCYINFSDKFQEITGLNYDTYAKGYFLICALVIGFKESNVMSIIDQIDFDLSIFGISKEQLVYIISLQAREYEFYRKYDNWNILKYFPIVKTKKTQKYIISNISALLVCFSEFMYWTIRNYYCSLKKRDFTAYFGHCFEFYLNELFDIYNIKAEKLVEDQLAKKPDWKVETQKYIFFIEQKAALYPMDTRSITSNKRLDTLDNYIESNIKKAFIQLNSYTEISDKIIIRMCLTFENINFPETIQELVLPNINLKGDEYLYWIISINEFEKLIYILSKNEEKFNNIIEEKIRLERIKSKDGRGFDTLLSKEQNDFIINKINYFDNYLRGYLKKDKRDT